MPQMNKEFSGPSEVTEMDRRSFLKYMGLFSSMSFLANCSRPAENIFPFSREIAEFSRHNVELYTSVVNHQGFAQGIVVKSFQGRPIKIEGNPLHPSSRGATTPQAQAALYDLYHPNRLQDLNWKGKKSPLVDLGRLLKAETTQWGDGAGVAFIFPPDHSPTQNKLIRELQRKYPASSWSSVAPWKKDSFSSIDLKEVELVVSFDEDIFYQRPDSLSLARDFMDKRRVAIKENNKELINSLIVLESSPTLAGAKADQCEVLTHEEIWNHALDLKNLLEGNKPSNPLMQKVFERIKVSKSAVFLNPELHLSARSLEAEINRLLKSPVHDLDFPLPETLSFLELMEKVKNKKIHTLISWDVDPAYWYPEYKEEWKKIPFKLSLSLFETHTTKISDAVVGRLHFLESWSDLQGVDGSVAIQQPLIKPIFHGISALSFLSLLKGEDRDSYEIVKESYPTGWQEALRTGVIKQTAPAAKALQKNYAPLPVTDEFTIKLTPDNSVGYGGQSNNPIMQELPKTFSHLTWQNAFYISEAEAGKLNLKNGDVIEVKSSQAKNEGPIWVVPNVASKTLVASLGYGQDKRGTNNFIFKNHEKIAIRKTSRRVELATTQESLFPENRNPIQQATLPLRAEAKKILPSLYPEQPMKSEDKGAQWGMTIDLTSCIGCQACVVACQVENNIPFVGEDQVKKGRILHWIRVDTYRIDNKTHFQPVACVHCEKAPCEVVCPVNATLHGEGGLNEMVYNRCVGTRYCSNNCPYRVRKFNFKAYSVLKNTWTLGFNPNVSVRDRGVMEKCTYCIQRINSGDQQSACQQVCPTNAIVFGDIKNELSEVAIEKKSPHAYDLLEDEGTLPRTSYLKVIRHELH